MDADAGRVLVTGATGFVGRHVARRLGASRTVRALVRQPASVDGATEMVLGDVTRQDTLRDAVRGVEAIVHCVAITGNLKEAHPGQYDEVNRGGTENLVHAAVEAGVKRVVLLSGLGTKPAPASTYMSTRWGMEEAVRGSGLPFAILRPSVQFGDGAEFVAAFARLARSSPVVPLLGGGSLRFQPIWVEDVVTCVEKCLAEDRLLGAEHTIGGSEQLTLRELIEAICATLGKRRVLAPLPLAVAAAQARLMSRLMARPPLTPATIELFGFDNVTDLDAVDRTFGFHPRGFREYLAERGVEA